MGGSSPPPPQVVLHFQRRRKKLAQTNWRQRHQRKNFGWPNHFPGGGGGGREVAVAPLRCGPRPLGERTPRTTARGMGEGPLPAPSPGHPRQHSGVREGWQPHCPRPPPIGSGNPPLGCGTAPPPPFGVV